MSNCEMEMCTNWNGQGCVCEVLGIADETWSARCDCGYVVEGLSNRTAERFAGQHADDEHEPFVTSSALS